MVLTGSIFEATEHFLLALWNLTDGTLLNKVVGPNLGPRELAFSPDGNLLAASEITPGGFYVYDARSLKLMKRMEAPKEPEWISKEMQKKRYRDENEDDTWMLDYMPEELWDADPLAFTRDGRYLLTAGFDSNTQNSIRRWNLTDWSCSVLLPEARSFAKLAFSNHGALLAYGTWEGEVVIVDYPSGNKRFDSKCHDGSIKSLLFFRNDEWLASAGEDGMIRLIDCRTFTLVGKLAGHRAAVLCLASSEDGSILYSGSDDTTILAWDVPTAIRGR